MKLEFANYRRPFTVPPATWSDLDRRQIEDVCEKCDFLDRLEDYRAHPDVEPESDEAFDMLEELAVMEVVDVVDEAGTPRYQVLFFDYGTAYMYTAGTTDEIGGACQHAFEINDGDPRLMAAIARAYANAVPEIRQAIQFV